MVRIGIHLMVWTGELTQRAVELVPSIKEMGYDGVELPLFAPESERLAPLRAALEEAALACTTSTALPRGLALIDEGTSARAVRWLQEIVRTAAGLGATMLCGPLLAPVGELRGRGYTPAEWASAVRGLREVGQTAEEHGVTLALEPLNRFETFMLNTVSDGVRLVEEVDSPQVGLLLDTFHMNIEERSIRAAILHAGRHLRHFHCSENDRGTVGSGHIPWRDVFSSLNERQYEGWLVVESFGALIPEIAAAACIWRPLAASPDVLARESVRFIRAELG